MTKEEMIAAVKECAEKMGRAPSFPELQISTKITTRTMPKQLWQLFTHAGNLRTGAPGSRLQSKYADAFS